MSNNGLIVTCYHVIGDNIRQKIHHKQLNVVFRATPTDIIQGATVLEQFSNPKLDIAFLKTDNKLPFGVSAAMLTEFIRTVHGFKALGFRKPHQFKGLVAIGIILGITNELTKASSPLIQLYSKDINNGMSGASIFDKVVNRVVGIVHKKYETT